MTEPKILYGIEGRNAAEKEPGMWQVEVLGLNNEPFWRDFEGASEVHLYSYMCAPSTRYRRKQSATEAAIRAVPLPEGYRLEGPKSDGIFWLIGPAPGGGASTILPDSDDWQYTADGLELRAKLTRALEGAK